MIRARTLVLAVMLSVAAAAPARADFTAFIGPNFTPANRLTSGLAAGWGLVIVGFEFEFASTTDDPPQGAPALKTGMGNVLLQSPVPIFGAQPYITVGAGLAREVLGTNEDTSIGVNTGGGVKINLTGPLRLRVDYRVFKLGNNFLYSPVHRVYVGLNLKF